MLQGVSLKALLAGLLSNPSGEAVLPAAWSPGRSLGETRELLVKLLGLRRWWFMVVRLLVELLANDGSVMGIET